MCAPALSKILTDDLPRVGGQYMEIIDSHYSIIKYIKDDEDKI